jgi:hypothetical protein
LTSFRDHQRHKNPHRWLAKSALMTFWLRLVAISELDRRRTSKMAVSNSNQLSSIWYNKARSAVRPRRMPMLISNISWRFSNKELCQPRRNAPMHFSPSFFRWARPMPFRTRSLPFNKSRMSHQLRQVL